MNQKSENNEIGRIFHLLHDDADRVIVGLVWQFDGNIGFDEKKDEALRRFRHEKDEEIKKIYTKNEEELKNIRDEKN